MTRGINPPNEAKFAAQIVYLILLIIAGVLILLLITGTIIGLSRKGNDPVITFGNSGQTASGINRNIGNQNTDIRMFTEIGRLRVPLADSSLLIISIVFPYFANDIAFAEELTAKVNDLRTIAGGYFSSLPAEALIHIDEVSAKREILRSFNANLRLGRIDVLYFNDLLVFDGGF